jgi:aquaporin Z
MRRYVVEAIGTFFLVFTVIAAVNNADSALAPVGIGAVLMVMVYAGGHISGAHYNPAVSLAAFVRGALPKADLGAYVAAQLLGAVAATSVGAWIFDPPATAVAFAGKGVAVALVAEVLFTFALAYVVLNVATSKDHPDNSFYGLAIGFTVVAGAIAVGPLSSAVFNPAVAVGITLASFSPWANIWVYFLAQLLGGALAGVAFRCLNPDDVHAETVQEPALTA